MPSIAKLGQNIQFVAFVAHAAVAYSILMTFPLEAGWLFLGIVAFAGVKEFWYDATYEKDPPQSFLDNLEDFLGYIGGAGLAYGVIRWS